MLHNFSRERLYNTSSSLLYRAVWKFVRHLVPSRHLKRKSCLVNDNHPFCSTPTYYNLQRRGPHILRLRDESFPSILYIDRRIKTRKINITRRAKMFVVSSSRVERPRTFFFKRPCLYLYRLIYVYIPVCRIAGLCIYSLLHPHACIIRLSHHHLQRVQNGGGAYRLPASYIIYTRYAFASSI